MENLDRRRFLVLAGSGLLAAPRPTRAEDEKPRPPATEAEARRSVEEKAKAAKLGPLNHLRSPHFQAMGDVPDGFLRLVLSDCEDVTRDFLRHFTAKGFDVKLPDRRMTVVVLSDDTVYGRFLGERASLASGGRYDFKNDRLVVYDYRPARDRVADRVAGLNLLTLAHEATHQLCYNGGLLDPAGDIPRVIVEGLATYAEDRPPGARSAMGRLNDTRLDDLAHLQRQTPWQPIKTLIATDDALLGKKGGVNLLLAYAQGWLLIYYCMNQPDRLAGLRSYLRAIRPRRGPEHRLEDAAKHLGDLGRLDAELKRESIRLLKSR